MAASDSVRSASSVCAFATSSMSCLSLASSANIVSVFSFSSSRSRPIASPFLPISASWLLFLAFICSTLISSRRVVIANSARSWSLSAWISASDIGVMASRRLRVSRTARAWTSGMTPITRRPANRNPIPMYMIGSIMRALLNIHSSCSTYHMRARRARARFLRPLGMIGAMVPRPSQPLMLVTGSGQNGSSERVPSRRGREFQVAHIGAEPQAHAGANRHHHDIVRCERRHAEAANEIGRAVDAPKTLVDRVGARQIVDQHHGARAFAAQVEAERGALPVDAQVAGVARVERAFAVAQPRHEGAARLLAEDVAVRLPPVADGVLDDLCEPA